jgi:hypothetical protein
MEGSFRFGTSPGVAAHTTSALLEWLRGNPERSADLAARALELSQELGHPFTTAYTEFHVAVLDLWRRNLSLVAERAGRVLEVAEEHGYGIWKAVALMMEGTAAAGLEPAGNGVDRMERGVAMYQGLTTPAVFWPLVMSIRARGFSLAGRDADALRMIDESVAAAGADAVIYPEFGVLRGEVLLRLGDRDAAVTELRRVFDVAGRFGLRMSQLRSATVLARAGDARAVDLLRSVYETFPDGFDEADLADARAVLAVAVR